jgi:ABC-type lipoprotein release transport system permease subunit
MLFGVSAGQPGIYAAVAVALLLVVLIASLTPALRAAAVDPVRAIRTE